MRPLLIGLVVAIGFSPSLAGQAPAPAAPKVQLTFEAGGTVSLVANGATLREILAEWTRKGGTPFVNAERLSGAPVSLQYDRRPETEVVASLLRGASGMIVAPRPEGSVAPGASQLEVVFVLATSTASAGGYSAPTYNAPQPQISSPGSPDAEIAPIGPGRSATPLPTQGPAPAQAPPARPAGVSGVAVPVVGVPTVTPTPPPPTTGRGGGGGGGR